MEVPAEDNFSELETRLQPMDVWVTNINAINEHEAITKWGLLLQEELKLLLEWRRKAEARTLNHQFPPHGLECPLLHYLLLLGTLLP
jgi:hypothetical protein